VFLILDLVVIGLGTGLAFVAALVWKDRQRNASAVLSIGCYVFALPFIYLVVAVVFGDPNGAGSAMASNNSAALSVPLALVPLVAVPLGLRLLGLPVSGPTRFLLIWNAALLSLAVWLTWFYEWPRGDIGTAYAEVFELAMVWIALFLGNLITMIVLLGRGLVNRQTRKATGTALVLGIIGSGVETAVVDLRGPDTWVQLHGFDVVVAALVVAAGIFCVARVAAHD
jgi:hypothetical protein